MREKNQPPTLMTEICSRGFDDHSRRPSSVPWSRLSRDKVNEIPLRRTNAFKVSQTDIGRAIVRQQPRFYEQRCFCNNRNTYVLSVIERSGALINAIPNRGSRKCVVARTSGQTVARGLEIYGRIVWSCKRYTHIDRIVTATPFPDTRVTVGRQEHAKNRNYAARFMLQLKHEAMAAKVPTRFAAESVIFRRVLPRVHLSA